MFTFSNSKTLSLEFRSKEGYYKFTLINKFAEAANRNLVDVPEFKKTTKIFNNVEYVVFECIKDCSCIFSNSLMLNIYKGDYIKIIK